MAEQNLIGTDPKFWDDFFQRAEAADNYTKEVVKQYEAKEKEYGMASDEMLSSLYKTRANDITAVQNYISGNTMTGPLPIDKFTLTTDQYLQKQMDFARNANDWAKDPFALSKPFDFNGTQYGLFFDRYYHHPKHKQFGFSPFRDNESFYNANSSKWDDWGRMKKVWDNLWWDGATGLFQNWGNYSLAGDRHHAEEMEKYMGIASSTKGGFEGFVTNLAGNSAFTAGVMSEILAEELGLFALSFVPGMQGLAAGRTIKNSVRFIDTLADFGKIINNMGDLKSMTRSLKSFTNSEKFYNGATKFGKGVLNFLNPLENTTDFIRGYEKLDDAAKFSRGVGAFYRDMRAINATLDEATLEGGFVQNKISADLLNKYYDEKGYLPDPYSEDAKKIHRTAELAGKTTSAINAGVIFYSNKIVFDKLVRPTNMLLGDLRAQIGTKGFRKVLQDGLPTIVTYTNKTARKFVDKGYLAELPKSFLRGSINYAGANLTEGIQELIQEGVAVGAENYYTNMYNNAMVGNQAMVNAAIQKGVASQMSGQGLEVFASGFLMGGPFNLIQNQAVNSIDLLKQNVYNSKLFGKKGVERKAKAEAFKKQMDQNAEQLASSMTAALRNPAEFINLLQENAVNQRNILQLYDQAAAKKDMKSMKDLDAESIAFHLHTMLTYNKLDILKSHLKDYLKMDDKALENALGQQINDGSQAPAIREKIQKSLDKINEYETLDKTFDEKFGTNEYEEGTISWHAFNRAKQNFVYKQYALNDKVSRLQSIYSDIASMPELEGIDQADITLLLTNIPLTHRPNSINTEIDLLVQELVALKQGGPQEKKQAETVQKKIENLKVLRDKLVQRETFYERAKQREAASTNPQDDQSVAEDKALADQFDLEAKEAFMKYLTDIAESNGRVLDQNKADSLFDKILDYRANIVDRDVLTRTINILSNPEYFRSFEARLKNIYEKLANNTKQYLEESLKKFQNTIFQLRVINELASAGVFLTPEGQEELNKGIMPTLYAIPSTAGRYGTDVQGSDTPLNELSPTSPNANIQARYRRAMEIIRDYELVEGTTLSGKKKFRTEEAPVNADGDVIRQSDDKRNMYDFYEQLGLDVDKDSQEISLEEFLEKIIQSEFLDYSTYEVLRALHVVFRGSADKITISKNLNQPVEYNERTGLAVDLQYFSADFSPEGTANEIPFERTMAKNIMQVLGQRELKKDKEFSDSIQEMLDNTVRWLSLDENKQSAIDSKLYPDPNAIYGLSSPEAFVAASMTDYRFQSLLSKIKSDKDKRKTVWKAFLDAVKNILDRVFTFGGEGSLLEESIDLITKKIFTKAKAQPAVTTAAPKTVDIKKSVKDKTLKTEFPDLYNELYDYVTGLDPNIADVDQYLIDNLDDTFIFDKIKTAMNDIAEDYVTVTTLLEEAKRIEARTTKAPGLSDSVLRNRVRRLLYPDAAINAMSREDMSTIVSNNIYYKQLQNQYDNAVERLKQDFNIPDDQIQGKTMAQVIDMYQTMLRDHLETTTEFALTTEQKDTVQDLLTLFERRKYKSFPVDTAGNIVTEEEDIKRSTRKLTFALDAEGNPIGKGFVRTTSLFSKLVEGIDKEKESFGSIHTARGTFADELLREFLQFNSPVRSKAAFISNAKKRLAELQASTDPADKYFKDLKYSDEFYSQLYDSYNALRNMALNNNIYIVTDMPRMYGRVMGEDVTGEGDIFAVYPNGKIEIWDLKTAMRSRRVDYAETNSTYKPKDAIQLNTYSEIVEQRGPKKISGTRIVPLEFGQEDNDGVVSEVKIDIDPQARTESVAKYTLNVDRKPVEKLVEQYQNKKAKAKAAMREEEEVTPTPPPAPPAAPVITPITAIEAEKTDIERRRQEELNKHYEGLTAIMSREDAYAGDDKISKEINAKYDTELARVLYREMKAGKQITEFTPEEQKILSDPNIFTQELRDSVDKEGEVLTEGEKKAVMSTVPEVTKATIELQKLGIDTNAMTSQQIIERYAELKADETKAAEEIEYKVGDTVEVTTGKKGQSVIKKDRGNLVLLEDGRQVAKKNLRLISRRAELPFTPAPPAAPVTEEVGTTEITDREFVTPTGKVIRLNDQQYEAYNAMRTWFNTPGGEKIFVLEGYAGTGKTTIVKKFMDSISADPTDPFSTGASIVVSAPTHKARKVIAKTTGRGSQTLHSLLGLRPDLDLNKLTLKDIKFVSTDDVINRLKTSQTDLIVIDESSMINKVLYDLILKVVDESNIKVLFMGDPAQLPPINETISKVFLNKNKYQLTKVERQTGDNPLMFIYDSIRNNIESSSDKFEHLSQVNAAGEGVLFTRSQNYFDDIMLQMFDTEEYRNNPDYVKVLAYHNARVDYYNQKIRNRLFNNPKEPVVEGEILTGYSNVNEGFSEIVANSVDYRVTNVTKGKREVEGYDGSVYTFEGLMITIEELGAERPNINTVFIMNHTPAQEKQYDRLMQIAAQGAERVGSKTKEGKKILATYLYGLKNYILLMEDIANREGKVVYPKTFTYGYAMTVHKSQGSTFTNVFVDENDIDQLPRAKERNQMKYVAMSRPSKMAYVLSKKALGKTDSGFSPVDEALFTLAGYTKQPTNSADNANSLVINTPETINGLAAEAINIKPGTILDVITAEDSVEESPDGVKYYKSQPLRAFFNGQEIGEINSYEGQSNNDTQNNFAIQVMLDKGQEVKLVVTKVDRVDDEITNITYQIVAGPEPEAARENLVQAITNRISNTTDKKFLETEESMEGDLVSFSIFEEYLLDLLDKQIIAKSEFKNFMTMIEQMTTTSEVTEAPAPVITPADQEEIKNQPVDDDLTYEEKDDSEVDNALLGISKKCNQ